MHVGWDWASQNHDVTVIDDTGTIHARFAIDHDEASLRSAAARPRAARRAGATCRWRSNDPTGSSSSVCSPPVIPSCRCTRTPFTPPDCAGVQGERSPTPLTATCWPTTSAPTDIAFADSARSTRSPANSKRWCGCETITSPPAPLQPTSSTHSSKHIGQAPTPSSPGSDPPSRWRSSTTTRHHSPQPASAMPASPCSAGDTPIEVAAPPPSFLQRLRTAAIAPIGLDPIVLTELVRSQTA